MNNATKKIKSPTRKTEKILYSMSGNRCSFPNCNQLLVVENYNLIGRMCHIKGDKPSSARYDSKQADEERHDLDNLILLCPNHHAVVDNDQEKYTVELLQEFKEKHIAKVNTILDQSNEAALKYLYGDFYDEIREFHENKIKEIDSDVAVLIHLFPLKTYNERNHFSFDVYENHIDLLKPLKFDSIRTRTTGTELYIYHSSITTNAEYSYVKVDKSGILEIVDQLILLPYEGNKSISSIGFEERIIERINSYLDFYEKIELEPPFFLSISLLNVNGYEISFGNQVIAALEVRNHQILEKSLVLPERVIEDYKDNIAKILKPCFDIIWNACNFIKGSPNYTEEGDWTPKGHFGI